jgi:hypothetical protein
MTPAGVLVVLYLAGVATGLAVMRDAWPARLVTAFAWPLGLVAFAVVVVIQLAAVVYLWPVPALVTLALLTAIWVAF